MNYYDLAEGHYKEFSITDDEMWSAFAYALSSKSSHSASYKFGFLKSILDNLYEVDSDLKLTFDQLFSKFAVTEDLDCVLLADKASLAKIIVGNS